MAIKGPAACQDQADNGEHTPPDESPKRSAREANKNDSFETNDKASATRKKKIEKKNNKRRYQISWKCKHWAEFSNRLQLEHKGRQKDLWMQLVQVLLRKRPFSFAFLLLLFDKTYLQLILASWAVIKQPKRWKLHFQSGSGEWQIHVSIHLFQHQHLPGINPHTITKLNFFLLPLILD